MEQVHEKIRAHCSVIEQIATGFTKDSIKQETLRLAGFAYSFAMLRHEQEFRTIWFLSGGRRKEQDYLRKLGS